MCGILGLQFTVEKQLGECAFSDFLKLGWLFVFKTDIQYYYQVFLSLIFIFACWFWSGYFELVFWVILEQMTKFVCFSLKSFVSEKCHNWLLWWVSGRSAWEQSIWRASCLQFRWGIAVCAFHTPWLQPSVRVGIGQSVCTQWLPTSDSNNVVWDEIPGSNI